VEAANPPRMQAGSRLDLLASVIFSKINLVFAKARPYTRPITKVFMATDVCLDFGSEDALPMSAAEINSTRPATGAIAGEVGPSL